MGKGGEVDKRREQPGYKRSQANGEPGACPAGSMPGSRAWEPTVGQMGFTGVQVLGESMPTTWEQSWIKLGWMRIGTEMTYKDYEGSVRTGSVRGCMLKAVNKKTYIPVERAL